MEIMKKYENLENLKAGDRVMIIVDNFFKGKIGKVTFLREYSCDIILDDTEIFNNEEMFVFYSGIKRVD